ncbi:MFS transporter [Nocardia huaxiensis]|uniref:MFS transporter n=1 Tax=Nocardia huaxiensis TaxID=2755382 RepID=A0A7D6V8Y1_9NOCA|nr:MFS transporter [Nocardia huaxiensis]QLY28522.1 MFS transporter [Nocardia huaxiensis]
MKQLMAERRAGVYFGAQLLTLFGDSMLFLGAGIWVKTLTDSNSAAGLTFLFLALPAIAAPAAGLLIDRVPRRSLLIAVNLILAVAVLPLLSVDDRAHVWLIYAVMFGLGCGAIVLGAAQMAILPALFGTQLLAQANSVMSIVQNGVRILAPLLGAALFTVTGPRIVVLVDSASFVLAAIALMMITVHEAPAGYEPGGLRSALTAGVSYIRVTVPLRQQIFAMTVAVSVGGMLESVIYAVVAAIGQPPAFLGVLVSLQAAAAVLAALPAPRLIERLGEGRLLAVGLLAFATANASLIVPHEIVTLTAMVFAGAGIVWTTIASSTYIQRVTPNPLLGRVDTAVQVSRSVPQALFLGLGAALVAVIDYPVLLAAMAATTAIVGTWLLTRTAQVPPAVPHQRARHRPDSH